MKRREAVSRIIGICRRLHRRGFVAATDGNVSLRLDSGNILTTRSGVSKGEIRSRDLVEVTVAGKVVRGRFAPSSELGMHLFIYTNRPEVMAVVHAHPPYATGFAVARRALDRPVLPEVVLGLGAIPLARYATPSTPGVAASLRPFIRSSCAVLLAGHGAVTWGTTPDEAWLRMEKVEHTAQIVCIARMLGGERVLTPAEVRRLRAVSEKSHGKKRRA